LAFSTVKVYVPAGWRLATKVPVTVYWVSSHPLVEILDRADTTLALRRLSRYPFEPLSLFGYPEQGFHWPLVSAISAGKPATLSRKSVVVSVEGYCAQGFPPSSLMLCVKGGAAFSSAPLYLQHSVAFRSTQLNL